MNAEWKPNEEDWYEATGYTVMVWQGWYDTEEESRAAWDHWLNTVKAEAWDRGHTCGFSDAQDAARHIIHGDHNPYQKGADA